MRHGRKLATGALAIFGVLGTTMARAQFVPGYAVPSYGYTPSIVGPQIVAYVFAAILGLLIGALFSDRLRQFRRWLVIGVGVLILLFSFAAPFPVNGFLTVLVVLFVFFIAIGFGLAWGRLAGGRGRSTTFGSAQWATSSLLQERGLVGEQGLALGYFPAGARPASLHYTGDRHLLTVAPTRAGKGVSAIIPNLLTYRGSALVIDPKGENAMITAIRRGQGDQARGIEGMGQKVWIVDPWGLTEGVTGLPAACFNPLDWIDPASPDAGENAMMLADSLVIPSAGTQQNGEFWTEEAKALLMGFILYVATDPEEAAQRSLGRVRDLLMLPAAEFEALCVKMAGSPQPIVASTGARTAGKDPELLSNVLASAQSHTHFLDSPRLRASLGRSDFRFEDLKRAPTTVYLVLPADRLNTFGRWLRLLVQQAITMTARNLTDKPERPILFLLDEMAALGRLSMVEQAYGLMAGFGMQLWGIVQDLSQLHRIYGDGWQTFIGNSGVLQYFGSRDKMTAEYFSDLCGMATVPTITSSITKALSPKGESSSSTSHNSGETQRKLIMADELMRVESNVQLVLVENLDPIAGRKITWYGDDRFKRHGVNVREAMAASRATQEPPPERMAAE